MTSTQIAAEELGHEPGIDLFELLCRRRGWTGAYLQAVENAEHQPLADIDRLVEALHTARTQGRTITIAPDFDMDGIASGVLGYAGLSELGFTVNLHLPDYRNGHELVPADIAAINKRWPDTSVLLTCDSAINSHDGIKTAQNLGWQVLVTDHHVELEPGCPADVVVNPCRIGETYAHKAICGAHVLHQVLTAYATKHAPEKTWEIHLLRLFAGLGTVSDVMPITFENRAMVRDALSIARLLHVAAPRIPGMEFDPGNPDEIDVERSTLMQLLRTDAHHPVYLGAFEGFALMMKAFAQHGKLRSIDDLDEGYFGFYLAPAMNSPRRVEEPLAPCFEVFTAPTPGLKLEAAHKVIATNERRKSMTRSYLQGLESIDQPLAPFVYVSDAPKGMLGLLANAKMTRAGHPVVVLNRPDARGRSSGSARAPMWCQVIELLGPREGLEAVGHQQACGVRVEHSTALADLAATLAEVTDIAATDPALQGRRADLVLGPADDCDADLTNLEPLNELTRRIEALAPFGHGFEHPVVELVLDPTRVTVDQLGTEGQHLRLTTRSGIRCLWWNSAQDHHEDLVDDLRAGQTVRLLARLSFNTFRGVTRLQAVVDDRVA